MIVGLGIDVVAIERVRRLDARFGPRFAARCFAPGEVRRRDPEHLAGLLAAKEAAFKALGTGWSLGVGWRQARVDRDPLGAPRLVLEGAAAERAAALGAHRILVSITHDHGLAAAVVVLEGE